MARIIAFFIYDNFQLLDAAGPITVFEIAARLAEPGAYDLRVVAREAGRVRSSSGMTLAAESLAALDGIDTLLIAGGEGSLQAMRCAETVGLIRAQAASARRVCSVCSGSFILGGAGLLDGLTATTHWRRAAQFARTFPKVRAEPDRIFIQQGRIWTSAGISAGIDLALALVADDDGEARAKDVAREMVVYYRRPGGQSQFSALVELNSTAHRFSGLLDDVRQHLAEPWTVERMAERACMSARHFSRAFAEATGMSPAKAVERLRLEAARERVENSAQPIESLAAQVGFGDPERMRRAFVQTYGVAPQGLRRQARATQRPGGGNATGAAGLAGGVG